MTPLLGDILINLHGIKSSALLGLTMVLDGGDFTPMDITEVQSCLPKEASTQVTFSKKHFLLVS